MQRWDEPATASFRAYDRAPIEEDIPDTFDYIIVGAGPSGSIVANKLAKADPTATILMLEAGPRPREDSEILNDPKNWVLIQENPVLEWGYVSTYEAELYGRAVPQSRSRGTGGCTIHNSLMWVRGGKKNYDEWVTRYGCQGWSWDDLLPYFQELERDITIAVGDPSKDTPWTKALIQAGASNGMQFKPNYNNNDGVYDGGAYYNQYTIKDGKRINIYDLYIKSQAAAVPNVTVWTDLFVIRVLFKESCEPKEAYAVQYRPMHDPFGTIKTVRARREIIMTAGVFGTPQILMLSGIGIRKDLEECKIPTVVESLGMGQSLCDDIFLALTYTTEKELPEDFMAYGIGGVLMFPTKNNTEISVQSNRMPGLFNVPDSWKPGYQVGADCHFQKSRGYMKLDPKHPEGLPFIQMNYLEAKEDMEQCKEAIKQIRSVGSGKSLKPWRPKEVVPGPHIHGDHALEAFIRGTAFSTMHPSGTCRMGAPRGYCGTGPSKTPPVVDPATLKVYGCERLRVMDNSVFPQNPHGNPACGVFAVALKGAHMIIEDMKKSK